MDPKFQEELRELLPEELSYPYFRGREAAWMLARRVAGPSRISDLRKRPANRLLEKNPLRELISRCGDGLLKPSDLAPLAEPFRVFDAPQPVAGPGVDVLLDQEIHWLTVSFGNWQACEAGWRLAQLSRPGENLVLQVNFPDWHNKKIERIRGSYYWDTDYCHHPIRSGETTTLAWARIDLDPWGEDMLIEEIQSDWLRILPQQRSKVLGKKRGLYKSLRLQEKLNYIDETLKTYRPIWAQATMLAAVAFGVSELGVKRIWLHQYETGQRLKNIQNGHAPRSIYTDLPRQFGFEATHKAPKFIARARPRVLGRLRRMKRPAFWLLDLGEERLSRAA